MLFEDILWGAALALVCIYALRWGVIAVAFWLQGAWQAAIGAMVVFFFLAMLTHSVWWLGIFEFIAVLPVFLNWRWRVMERKGYW